jgi:hypothetical protein
MVKLSPPPVTATPAPGTLRMVKPVMVTSRLLIKHLRPTPFPRRRVLTTPAAVNDRRFTRRGSPRCALRWHKSLFIDATVDDDRITGPRHGHGRAE